MLDGMKDMLGVDTDADEKDEQAKKVEEAKKAEAGEASGTPAKSSPATKPAPSEAPGKESASATTEGKGRTYKVKKGDNLTAIGRRFDVDWRDIARINDIKDPDLIFPGQVFKIPNK